MQSTSTGGDPGCKRLSICTLWLGSEPQEKWDTLERAQHVLIRHEMGFSPDYTPEFIKWDSLYAQEMAMVISLAAAVASLRQNADDQRTQGMCICRTCMNANQSRRDQPGKKRGWVSAWYVHTL